MEKMVVAGQEKRLTRLGGGCYSAVFKDEDDGGVYIFTQRDKSKLAIAGLSMPHVPHLELVETLAPGVLEDCVAMWPLSTSRPTWVFTSPFYSDVPYMSKVRDQVDELRRIIRHTASGLPSFVSSASSTSQSREYSKERLQAFHTVALSSGTVPPALIAAIDAMGKRIVEYCANVRFDIHEENVGLDAANQLILRDIFVAT